MSATLTDLPGPRWRPAALAACVITGLVLASVGLGDEHYVSLQGDMPRHLMNGVFFLDLVRDWPSPVDAFEYARYYYARYPALSLGHHPFLIALVEAPIFAVFGVSVTSARLASLLFFGTGIVCLFALGRAVFKDTQAAAAAALTLASSPLLVELAQSVMTELPAVCLVTAAAYFCQRFADTGDRRAILAATVLAAAAAWAKQIAVVALPGLIVYVWWRVGVRRLFKGDVLVATLIASVVVAPLVPLTLYLSPFNVALATGLAQSVAQHGRMDEAVRALTLAWQAHFTPAVLAAAGAGFVLLVARRHVAALLVASWVGTTAVFVVLMGTSVDPERYGIYWIPAVGLALGAAVSPLAGRARPVAALAVGIALLTQIAAASSVRLPGAAGYEEAARFVVGAPRGSTVMFAGDIDTGFFTFFVRKHDPTRQSIVLRADKILTTSFMGAVAAEDRVSSREELRATLRRFGVGYVVVEERKSESEVQNWLLDEVRTPAYAERLRVPTQSTDVRLRSGTAIAVYEVLAAPAAAADARLDIRLPLVSQQIDIPLSDLVARRYLR